MASLPNSPPLNLLDPEDDWLTDEDSDFEAPTEIRGMKFFDEDLYRLHRDRHRDDEKHADFCRQYIGLFRLKRFFRTVRGFIEGDADLTGRWPERWKFYGPRFSAVATAYAELASHCRVEVIRNPIFSDERVSHMMDLGFAEDAFVVNEYIIEPPSLLDDFGERFGLPPELVDYAFFERELDDIMKLPEPHKPRFQQKTLLDLPNEILDHIVELLSSKRQRVLSQCCSRLRDVCYRYIYSSWSFHLRSKRGFNLEGMADASISREVVSAFARLRKSIDRVASTSRVVRDLQAVTVIDDLLLRLDFGHLHDDGNAFEGLARASRRVDTSLGSLLRSAHHVTTLDLSSLPIGIGIIKAFSSLPYLRSVVSCSVGIAPEAEALLHDQSTALVASSVRSFTLRKWRYGAPCPALGLLICFPDVDNLNVLGHGFADLRSLDDLRPFASPRRLAITIGGFDSELDVLMSWIRRLASNGRSLRLQALRLTSHHPLLHDQLHGVILPTLIHAAALSHLELNGICDLMPADVRAISRCLPFLENLALMSRCGARQTRTRNIRWQRPLYEYARELAPLRRLKCLFLNDNDLSPCFSPASIELVETNDLGRWDREFRSVNSDYFDDPAQVAALCGVWCLSLETVFFGTSVYILFSMFDLKRTSSTGFVEAKPWKRRRAEHPSYARFESSQGSYDEAF